MMRIDPDSVVFDNTWFFRFLRIGNVEPCDVGNILFVSYWTFFGYHIGVPAEDGPGLRWQQVQLGDPHPLHPGYFLAHHEGQAPIWAYCDSESDDYNLDD